MSHLPLVCLYATFPTAQETQAISRTLIAEKLVACANILPSVQSLYIWQDALEENTEVAVIYKSDAAHVQAAIARLAALHSYDVPCITSWPLSDVFPPYAQWVSQSLT